jgi:hypothetical protein
VKDEGSNYQEYLESQDVTAPDHWPGLANHFRRTSDPDIGYNGLAWALGSTQRNFDPEKIAGYYWAPGVPRECTITAYLKLLALHQYELEARDGRLEEGWEKIAIYVDAEGEPRHFARQLENGKWTSKLVDLIDIEHDDLTCLEGENFGHVNSILMRRRVQKREA